MRPPRAALLLVVAVTACADRPTSPSTGSGGPQNVPAPITIATRWSGTSERTEVVGGECAGDLLRTSSVQTANRTATVAQTGSELAVVFSARSVVDSDTQWAGSVDRNGHIALAWRAPSSLQTFLCRNGAVRRVEMAAAAASLDLSPEGQDLTGTITTTYAVRTTTDGESLGTMTEVTRERLRRVSP